MAELARRIGPLPATLSLTLSLGIMAVLAGCGGGATPTASTSTCVPVSAGATGADIQNLLDNNAGATFCFEAGTYRLTVPLRPHSNQKLLGAPAHTSILTGSTIVTSWTQTSSGQWVSSDGWSTPTNNNHYGSFCLASSCTDIPADFKYGWAPYSDDVFSTNPGANSDALAVPGMLEKVGVRDLTGIHQEFSNAKATLHDGQYFVDYTDHTITLGDNPFAPGTVIERTVSPGIIDGSAVSGVVVRGFLITNSGHFGIQAGSGWTIQDNEIRLAATTGIRVGDGNQILSNYVHHNGQYGMNVGGDNALMKNNELAYNNAHRYYIAGGGSNANWASGATKFVNTNGLHFDSNYSHDNFGDGFWHDINGVNVWVQGNRFINNERRGVNIEISQNSSILNNTVTGGIVGIWINTSGSSNISEIAFNSITNTSSWGIYVLQQLRAGPGNGHPVENLSIHDNTISQHAGFGRAAGLEWQDQLGSDPYGTTANNHFQGNHYAVDCTAAIQQWWFWSVGLTNWSGWQSYGNDDTNQSSMTCVQ